LIALLMNPDNAIADSDLRDAEGTARVLGRQTVTVSARSQRDFNAAFAAMAEQHVGAALVASDPILVSERATIAELSAHHAIPLVHFAREFVVAGGLASYGRGMTWMYHQAGIFTSCAKGSRRKLGYLVTGQRREVNGDMIIVRYADDFIVGFQYEHDARGFLDELRARLQEFALSLHPEKTRLIEFGRFARLGHDVPWVKA
jgi:hypothetical protein